MKVFSKPLGSVIAFALAAALGCVSASASSGPSAGSADPNTAAPAVTKETYKIIVDKKTQIFSVLSKDADGAYTVVVRQMRCSTARVDKETPVGKFRIGTKRRWLSSKKYGTHEQYASRIVGSIWIHSTIFRKKDPYTLVNSSFQHLGHRASAGCVRLSVGDAKWVFEYCPKGTVVEIVKSGGPEAVCVETLPSLQRRANFDPTDPVVLKKQAPQNTPPVNPDAPQLNDPNCWVMGKPAD